MKKILIIAFLIMFMILIFQVNSLYALYKDEMEGDITTTLGIWNIKVDRNTVTGGVLTNFNITNDYFNIVHSNLTQDGKFAPNSEAYVDIEIDGQDTDVSIIYEIEIALDEETNADLTFLRAENKFKSTSNEETTNSQSIVDLTNNKVKGIFPLEKISSSYKNKIRLYFMWDNNETRNADDSALGSSTGGATLTVPVTVNLKQYNGETLAF